MNVTQLINNNGNPAANHFVILCDDGSRVLQSYKSLVAKIETNGNIVFGENWDYSTTTLKHLKIFLGTSLSKKDLQKRIDNGNIKIQSIVI